jgi:NADH-quinone oxidoreductase subunit E
VQEKNPHKYLPQETLRYIADRMEIPLSRIYSVATFYALFNLEPQGENTVCICRGTACHTRGARPAAIGETRAWTRYGRQRRGDGEGGGHYR